MKQYPPFLLPLCVGLFLFISLIMFNQIEEDAFIYFRIAANIANGHGYVFNAGGEHIESGSSLLWQLMLVLLYYLPFNIVISAKLLGIGCGCIALYLIYLISREVIRDYHLQILPSYLLAVSIPFYCWSQRGLETSFFLCSILALAYACCNKKLYPYWHIFAFILFCARPEGFLILLATIPFLFSKRRLLPHFSSDVCILIFFVSIITLFRGYYFHDLVPHTFYIKMDTGFLHGIKSLLRYASSNFLAFLLLPALPAFFVKRFWTYPMNALVPFFIVTGFWFILGGDDKPYDRKIIPALTFFFIITASAYDRLYKNRFRPFLKLAAFAFIFIVLCFAKTTYKPQNNEHGFFINTFLCVATSPRAYLFWLYNELFSSNRVAEQHSELQPVYKHLHVPLHANYQATTGKFIKLNYPENISIVFDQMGQTPWYAGLDKKFFDSWGLTDRSLGLYSFGQYAGESILLKIYRSFTFRLFNRLYPHEKRHFTEKEALDYLFNKKPELIMINQVFPAFFPWTFPAKIDNDPRLRERYEYKYLVNGTVKFYHLRGFKISEPLKIPEGCKVGNVESD